MNETPKRHILGRKHVVWRIDCQNRTTCARSTRAEEYSKKKVYLRNHNMCFSRVRPDHPRCRSATWICVCSHTRDPIIYSEFHRNPFRGFGAPGGQNLAFPIALASRFYNSLYYRTSRDKLTTWQQTCRLRQKLSKMIYDIFIYCMSALFTMVNDVPVATVIVTSE